MKNVSYKKLWHLLIDKGMNKSDLRRATGISSSTLALIVSDETVTVEVLLKICSALDCDFADIMEVTKGSKTIQKTKFME